MTDPRTALADRLENAKLWFQKPHWGHHREASDVERDLIVSALRAPGELERKNDSGRDSIQKAEIATNAEASATELTPWRDELSEIIAHLGVAIIQSTDSDDRIIMDHVKSAHEIAKIIWRKA